MKFLIQKIEGELRHDFSFALIESIRFKNWLNHYDKKIIIRYANTYEITDPDMIYPNPFKPYHKDYVPVGSVEFVTDFLNHFYGIIPKPINVPEVLMNHQSYDFTMRKIFNGNHLSLENWAGKYFVKSNDKIKHFTEIVECKDTGNQGTLYSIKIPVGNYQISELINIDSEWRAFVYQDKLIGLQNYSGDFKKFPNVDKIMEMIKAYVDAPIAYTLDIGVGEAYYDSKYGYFINNDTFIIEIHDFFSCGLYGFNSQHYPNMLYRWFKEYLKKNM